MMKPKRILHLTLKKRWFDMIASGVKKEEYREIKPYWTQRLEGKEYDFIVFKNGYGANVPSMTFPWLGYEKKNANAAWCGGETPYCYAIKIGTIISNI